ncbi:hypothetical protein [Nocardiopsis suaedae]|uniref:Lipoprotein n=1 Tax=Nocardiopsis suaedae TaxID=3018444 RepID=A0ABT4TNG2_9ACTN|nr:hypothetical protein [Nocardiopsis suaedae]MDA2806238.1 hypothetical protein [Nocardiopsis suaedae]
MATMLAAALAASCSYTPDAEVPGDGGAGADVSPSPKVGEEWVRRHVVVYAIDEMVRSETSGEYRKIIEGEGNYPWGGQSALEFGGIISDEEGGNYSVDVHYYRSDRYLSVTDEWLGEYLGKLDNELYRIAAEDSIKFCGQSRAISEIADGYIADRLGELESRDEYDSDIKEYLDCGE